MRSDRERLLDIAAALENIERRRPGDRSSFDQDELVQIWMVHQLQIVGEAMSRVSESLRHSHAEVPWRQIIGMRHVLVHGYFDLDQDLVWQAINREAPKLMLSVSRMLADTE